MQAALDEVKAEVLPLYKEYQYGKALASLKKLTAPINDYLDNVMVMVDDEKVKANRVSQLISALDLFRAWGDFSKLV